MARRTFNFGAGGKFVQLDRGGDEAALQWRAARRLGARAGAVELIIERDDGTYRNLGEVDWNELDGADPDDIHDYIDELIDGDGDSGYYGAYTGAVSIVAR